MPRRRRRIMGLPIGPAKKGLQLGQAARVGMAGAAVLTAVPPALRRARMLQDSVSSHTSTLGKAAGLVTSLAQSQNGKGDDAKPKLAHLIEEHTDVSVPRSVAYNQWTQMEIFPGIVKAVTAVDQLSDERTEWTSKIGPVRRRWKARITEQVPDELIRWKSETGPEHEGVVTFHSLDDELTRLLVQIRYKPHGPLEVMANTLRVQRRRTRRDLRLFKHFLEMRGEESGAWRGRIGEGTGAGGRRTNSKAGAQRKEASK